MGEFYLSFCEYREALKGTSIWARSVIKVGKVEYFSIVHWLHHRGIIIFFKVRSMRGKLIVRIL